MLITKYNVRQYLREFGFKFSFVYPISKKHFVLREDIKIELSNKRIITIPSGFVFDGSSVPRFLWWVFPSYGDFFFAAMIHDWCYMTDYRANEIGIKKARKFADKEMLIWSNILNDKNRFKKIDNTLRYHAVRWFGREVYIR